MRFHASYAKSSTVNDPEREVLKREGAFLSGRLKTWEEKNWESTLGKKVVSRAASVDQL